MEVDIRYFEFSSKIFGGFTCQLDVSDIESIGELEGLCLSHLINTLTELHFEELLKLLEDRNFHIHTDLDEIKNGLDLNFYVCECGNSRD